MSTTQYVSRFSGEEIDAAVAAYNFNKNHQRVIFSHAITATTDWQGSQAPYNITITLNGAYSIGEYPIIYFIDESGERYEVDYTTTISTSASTSTVYSNVKKLGKIIEVASVSNSEM